MHSIIILASGTGSNTQAIIDYFKQGDFAYVSFIVSNKPDAGVLNIAIEENIPSLVVNKADFSEPSFLQELRKYKPSLIVLAGFLWKIPAGLIKAFPDSIINIHPALLPAYGGKGMYGGRVHEAVILAGASESGITIHYVDEVYDNGNKILQAFCPVTPADTAHTLARKIHKLEHFYYPRTIQNLLENI